MLNPILFGVYVDDLLRILSKANVGCFIGSFFVGVFAYADDIVLLAHTASAMRRMLQMCEEYASDLSVLFNASKSKCIICDSSEMQTPVSYTHLTLPTNREV